MLVRSISCTARPDRRLTTVVGDESKNNPPNGSCLPLPDVLQWMCERENRKARRRIQAIDADSLRLRKPDKERSRAEEFPPRALDPEPRTANLLPLRDHVVRLLGGVLARLLWRL